VVSEFVVPSVGTQPWVTMEEPDYQLFSSLRFDPLLLHSSANTTLHGSKSPFYMLPYHRDRILQAATHFGWPAAEQTLTGPEGLQRLGQALEKSIDLTSAKPLRVRVLVSHTGDITIETNEASPVLLNNLFPSRLPPPRGSELKVSPLTGGALTLGREASVTGSPGHGAPEQVKPWTVMVDPHGTQPSPFTTYKTTSRNMYSDARARVAIETLTDPKEVLIISIEGGEIMEGSLTSVFFWRKGRWVTPPISSGGQAGTTRRWLLEKGLCEEEVVTSSSLTDGEECWISNGVRGLNWGTIKL